MNAHTLLFVSLPKKARSGRMCCPFPPIGQNVTAEGKNEDGLP